VGGSVAEVSAFQVPVVLHGDADVPVPELALRVDQGSPSPGQSATALPRRSCNRTRRVIPAPASARPCQRLET